MTRLSTGYTFLNIQEHSKYILKNIDKIDKVEKYNLGQKYKFLDNIFLKVLKNNPEIKKISQKGTAHKPWPLFFCLCLRWLSVYPKSRKASKESPKHSLSYLFSMFI